MHFRAVTANIPQALGGGTRIGAMLALALLAGCGSNGTPAQPILGGGTPTTMPTGMPTSAGTTCTGGTTASIGAAGGSVTGSAAMGTFTETIPAGDFASATTVTLAYESSSNLPAPLLRAQHRTRGGGLAPMFTQGAGNTYVAAFCTSFAGATLTTAASLSGAGIVGSSIAAGTQLNIAMYQGSTWVDVGTAVVGSGGSFQSTAPTVALPGIKSAGSYLVYVPAGGTNTAQLNLGIAIIGDDGTAALADGIQVVQLEDQSGNALATPTTNFYPVSGLDLDGQSLTPDASRGAIVDGSSLVYFFSGVSSGTFTLASSSVNVSQYGSDGDSIVSLPSGDQAVVTADNGGPLVVISGILAGSPVVADTISNPGSNLRDGLVISTDGKVMLSRGRAGLDVYSVTQTSAHAGSTGVGTTSYNFNLTTTFASPTAIAQPYLEDGRDGMAFSPNDSSRALVVGLNATGTPTIQLLTGLTGSTPTVNTLSLRLPAVPRRLQTAYRIPEASGHREPFAITPSGGTTIPAITITPDGTTAYALTDAGIVTIGGVNTGTLTQVGSLYNPSITVPGGGTCSLNSSFGTLGVLPDGKYLVVDVSCGLATGSTNTTQGSGVLITIPIGAGGALGTPVGQLNNVVAPFNDQMILH